MLIVGENLKQLIAQHQMCSTDKAFDNNSITLSLDRQLISISPPVPNAEITYGHHIPETWLKHFRMNDSGFILTSRGCVLGCSHEDIKIPSGYFGLLQTKGSLARLFVTIQCGDGQVDAGYSGRVTFEIMNLSNFNVRLLPLQQVAQLFIFRTSSRLASLYEGRYQEATGPTIQLPSDETARPPTPNKKARRK